MKKITMVIAAAAVFGIPLFAENKVGKVTGIQVKENEAIVSIAEGLINPFEEGGFTKSGDANVTVPPDVAVEFYFPKMAKAPEGFQPKDADGKKRDARTDDKRAENQDEKADKKPEFPKLEVKNLKIDQLVQVVYAADGKTVEKIQIQPMMFGRVNCVAHFKPAQFHGKGENNFRGPGNFRGSPDGNGFDRPSRNSDNGNGSGRFWGKDPAHPTPQKNWR